METKTLFASNTGGTISLSIPDQADRLKAVAAHTVADRRAAESLAETTVIDAIRAYLGDITAWPEVADVRRLADRLAEAKRDIGSAEGEAEAHEQNRQRAMLTGDRQAEDRAAFAKSDALVRYRRATGEVQTLPGILNQARERARAAYESRIAAARRAATAAATARLDQANARLAELVASPELQAACIDVLGAVRALALAGDYAGPKLSPEDRAAYLQQRFYDFAEVLRHLGVSEQFSAATST